MPSAYPLILRTRHPTLCLLSNPHPGLLLPSCAFPGGSWGHRWRGPAHNRLAMPRFRASLAKVPLLDFQGRAPGPGPAAGPDAELKGMRVGSQLPSCPGDGACDGSCTCRTTLLGRRPRFPVVAAPGGPKRPLSCMCCWFHELSPWGAGLLAAARSLWSAMPWGGAPRPGERGQGFRGGKSAPHGAPRTQGLWEKHLQPQEPLGSG